MNHQESLELLVASWNETFVLKYQYLRQIQSLSCV
jgi:hypothetical protein